MVLGLIAFYPIVFEAIASPRFILVALLALWVITLSTPSRPSRWLLVAATGPVALLFVFAAESFLGASLSAIGAANAQRYFLLYPLGLAAGGLTVRAGLARQIAIGYLMVASGTVILATIEYSIGSSLFGRDFLYFVEYGRPRALLASDHPLVLGLLFLIGLALTPAVSTKARVPLVILMTWGIWTTGSEGPMLLAIPVALVALIPALGRWMSRARWLLQAGVVGAAILAGFLVTMVWTPEAAGTTSGEYSRAYRAAMYSLLPDILANAPFGYGFDGLPTGLWLIQTEYKGIRDIGVTIDSEIVFLAAVFGVGGLALFVTALVVGIRTLNYSLPFALALLSIAAVGAVLAVSVWNTLAAVSAVVAGCCIASRCHQEPLEKEVHRT